MPKCRLLVVDLQRGIRHLRVMRASARPTSRNSVRRTTGTPAMTGVARAHMSRHVDYPFIKVSADSSSRPRTMRHSLNWIGSPALTAGHRPSTASSTFFANHVICQGLAGDCRWGHPCIHGEVFRVSGWATALIVRSLARAHATGDARCSMRLPWCEKCKCCLSHLPRSVSALRRDSMVQCTVTNSNVRIDLHNAHI